MSGGDQQVSSGATAGPRPSDRADGRLDRLDDEDFPALTMGQASELLGVQPAFLRSLEATGALHPQRSAGGHRRYSRAQLRRAARIRELSDHGHTLAAAAEIVALRDDLAATERERDDAREERDRAREELARAHDDLARAHRDLYRWHEQASGRNGSTGDGADERPATPSSPR